MIRRHGLFALALLLGLAAGLRDGFDRWVDRTELPPTLVETSVEVRDRDGALLRVSLPFEVVNLLTSRTPEPSVRK